MMKDPRPENPPEYYPQPPAKNEAWAERMLDARENADLADQRDPRNCFDHGGNYRWNPETERIEIVRGR